MKCETCKQESPVVLRVVVAKDYNRMLSRPIYNCPACFEQKERSKPYGNAGASGAAAGAASPGATKRE